MSLIAGSDNASGPVGSRSKIRETLTAWALIAPAFIIFGLFAFRPLYRLVHLGLHQQNRTGTAERWVGWSQYRETLTGDEFQDGLWHTIQFVLYTVPIGLVLGVLLAVAANRRLKGMKIFQTIFSSTVATSSAVASLIFFVLLEKSVGILPNLDSDIGWVDWAVGFVDLQDPSSAMRGVALSAIWQNLGLTFIIVLAGLQAVPDDVLEAAEIDGYGAVRRFFRITLPMISPTLIFLVVALTISGLQAFAQIDVLTGGGPAGSTETLVYKIWENQQNPPTLGAAAVTSIGLFLVTMVIAAVQFFMLDRRVHYGD
jgi:sn-glycerol 3-phosphate transport system permease protein